MILEGERHDRRTFGLDDAEALDIRRSGAKAAWLARARAAGFPVLPGVVVDARESGPYLEMGAAKMAEGGSGTARLAVIRADHPAAIPDLEAETAGFSEPMVVRSSSVLEGSGEWSGAFTSYLDLRHGELGTGVLGCWASSFTAHTVERFEAAGLSPAEAPMAVLVQPALETEFGGTARLVSPDEVEVVGIKGSPAPLVQGWDPGVAARFHLGEESASGNAAAELLGTDLIAEIARLLADMHASLGVTGCEWGLGADGLAVFQVTKGPLPTASADVATSPLFAGEQAVRVASLTRRYPGALGESFVLPWAIGAIELPDPTVDVAAGSLADIEGLVESLTAEVWGLPKNPAMQKALTTLRQLRGSEPEPAFAAAATARPPDLDRARHILAMLAAIAEQVVAAGVVDRPSLVWHLEPATIEDVLRGAKTAHKHRIGFDRWEPFNAAVVLSAGATTSGASAAPGIAAGRMCRIVGSDDLSTFRPRDVIVANHPVPNLAPLLWDASAIVTTGGSAAAHLFESARALAIPAIAGVRIEPALGGDLAEVEGEFVLAVDGHSGTVSALRW